MTLRAFMSIWLGLTLVACQKGPAPSEGDHEGAKPIAVTVLAVQSVVVPKTVEGFGSLLLPPSHVSTVASATGGRVLGIHARVGDRVARGQLLVSLQADPTAQADLAKARIALLQAKRERDRQAALVAAGVAARMRAEDAESAYQSALADYGLKRRAAELANQNAALRAPLAGVVTDASVSIGMVLPAQAPAMTISDLHGMWAEVAVPPEALSRLRIGQPALVTLASGAIARGSVVAVNRVVSPDTQRGSVRIALADVPAAAQAGAYARARIDDGETVGLLVPATAVVIQEGHKAVYVVQQGTAHRRPVDVVETTARGSVVTGQVTAGEAIVTSGVAELTDGVPVVTGTPRP